MIDPIGSPIEVPKVGEDACGNKFVVDFGERAFRRLSFFLRGSMPDAQLLASARADGFKTREQLGAQVKLMLADVQAKSVVTRFHEQWLHLDRLATSNSTSIFAPALRIPDTVLFALVFDEGFFGSDVRSSPSSVAIWSFRILYGYQLASCDRTSTTVYDQDICFVKATVS